MRGNRITESNYLENFVPPNKKKTELAVFVINSDFNKKILENSIIE